MEPERSLIKELYHFGEAGAVKGDAPPAPTASALTLKLNIHSI
jgi:hypothetical protein